MSTVSLAETEYDWSRWTGNGGDSERMKAWKEKKSRGIAAERREQMSQLDRVFNWLDDVAGHPPANPFKPLELKDGRGLDGYTSPAIPAAQPSRVRRGDGGQDTVLVIPSTRGSQPPPQIIVIPAGSNSSDSDDTDISGSPRAVIPTSRPSRSRGSDRKSVV